MVTVLSAGQSQGVPHLQSLVDVPLSHLVNTLCKQNSAQLTAHSPPFLLTILSDTVVSIFGVKVNLWNTLTIPQEVEPLALLVVVI